MDLPGTQWSLSFRHILCMSLFQGPIPNLTFVTVYSFIWEQLPNCTNFILQNLDLFQNWEKFHRKTSHPIPGLGCVPPPCPCVTAGPRVQHNPQAGRCSSITPTTRLKLNLPWIHRARWKVMLKKLSFWFCLCHLLAMWLWRVMSFRQGSLKAEHNTTIEGKLSGESFSSLREAELSWGRSWAKIQFLQ
jgi:hypothetical protein